MGEGCIGLYAVSNVIANRSKKWDKTPYEIVTQKNQFYGYTANNREELYNQGKDYCNYLAENILELDDITDGALYFRRVGEKKRSWHLKFCIKIKNHLFIFKLVWNNPGKRNNNNLYILRFFYSFFLPYNIK